MGYGVTVVIAIHIELRKYSANLMEFLMEKLGIYVVHINSFNYMCVLMLPNTNIDGNIVLQQTSRDTYFVKGFIL